MEYAGEKWVKRWRAGRIPGARGIVIAVAVLIVVGAVLLVLEWSDPRFVAGTLDSRGGVGVVLGPPALVVGGVALAVASWWRQRSDRALVAVIRRAGTPSLFIPVASKGYFASETLPPPRPTVWTVDASGLHGWAPSAATPVIDLPWSEIDGFEQATSSGSMALGQRVDYGVRVLGARKKLVLTPRADLGRPLGGGAFRIDVLMRLLRSFQRQLAPTPPAAAPPADPTD